jgi:hypothetical protein
MFDVDLNAFVAKLIAAVNVNDAMHLAHIALWLRCKERPR